MQLSLIFVPRIEKNSIIFMPSGLEVTHRLVPTIDISFSLKWAKLGFELNPVPGLCLETLSLQLYMVFWSKALTNISRRYLCSLAFQPTKSRRFCILQYCRLPIYSSPHTSIAESSRNQSDGLVQGKVYQDFRNRFLRAKKVWFGEKLPLKWNSTYGMFLSRTVMP